MKAQLVAATLGGMLTGYLAIHQARTQEKLLEQNLTYDKQLEVLTQVQASLDNLKDFVGNQKEQLRDQQVALERLKSESEKLRPVVEADRQVVDALFRLQAENFGRDIWIDRLIAFLVGVVSSLIASIIWSAIRGRRSDKSGPHPTGATGG